MEISLIKEILEKHTELEFAILVGSQANGRAHTESDWDIALQWNRDMTMLDNLSKTETLRRELAVALKLTEDKVDLIDLPRAGLAMRSLVAEEGISLKGEDSLAWNHFLARVWRELEYYEWDKEHAA